MQPLAEHDPTTVGRWELVGRIASGGMGDVFLGQGDGEFAAVKVIRPELVPDDQARERFRTEVAALSRVRSPFVIRLIDADADAGLPWLAMAYEPATNLEVTIARSGPLARHHGLLFLAKLAEGVKALHEHGIVHRDLKPANILVTDEGPRIIDLGIVKTEQAGLTRTYAPRTEHWASPEQLKANPDITAATDVFNLGLVAGYSLTAKHPFGSAETMFDLAAALLAMGRGEPRDLDVDADIAEVLMECFTEPEDRPTPGELAQAFANLARGHAVDAARGDFGMPVLQVRPRAQPTPDIEETPDHLADWYVVFPRSLAGQAPDETHERLLTALERTGFDVSIDDSGRPCWVWEDLWFGLTEEPARDGRQPQDLWLWLELAANRLDLARSTADVGGRIVHCSGDWGGRLYVAVYDDVQPGMAHLVALESTPDRAHGVMDEIHTRFPRHGKTWTAIEEQQLVDAFLEGAALEVLVRSHGRTPSALCARLEQQGVASLMSP
jgi:serine/threonine protein kinase